MEREQRWVLRALPEGLDAPVSIVDLYIRGTRLRLRRMEGDGGVVLKLGQKVRAPRDRPDTVKLTTMYLSGEEYAVVAALEGSEIVKTRWRWSGGECPMAVDEFGGELTGLVLAEVELHPDEARWPNPICVVADVTDDDRFCGGALSATKATELRDLLAEHGVTPTPWRRHRDLTPSDPRPPTGWPRSCTRTHRIR